MSVSDHRVVAYGMASAPEFIGEWTSDPVALAADLATYSADLSGEPSDGPGCEWVYLERGGPSGVVRVAFAGQSASLADATEYVNAMRARRALDDVAAAPTLYVIADDAEQADALIGQYGVVPGRTKVIATRVIPAPRFVEGDVVAVANAHDAYAPAGLSPAEILDVLALRRVQRGWLETVLHAEARAGRLLPMVFCAFTGIRFSTAEEGPTAGLARAIRLAGDCPPPSWFAPDPIDLATIHAQAASDALKGAEHE